MPKYIENLRSEILRVAKKQLSERGYSGMTMRSISEECRIAVGTAYNYYQSKDDIVANFMLDDWNSAVAAMTERSENAASAKEALDAMDDELRKFVAAFAPLFNDERARANFGAFGPYWHERLLSQLNAVADGICSRFAEEPSLELTEFIASTVLRLSVSGKYDSHGKFLLKFFRQGTDSIK